MCLNSVLGSLKAKIMNATVVITSIAETKMIFVLRTKGHIYSFSSFLNLYKFLVKNI